MKLSNNKENINSTVQPNTQKFDSFNPDMLYGGTELNPQLRDQKTHLQESQPIKTERFSNNNKDNFATGLRNAEPQVEPVREYNNSQAQDKKSFYTTSSIRSKGRNKLTINDLNNTDYNKNLTAAERMERSSQKSKTSGNGKFPSIHKREDIYGGNPYEPKIESLVNRNNGIGMKRSGSSVKSYSQKSEPKLDIQTGGFN